MFGMHYNWKLGGKKVQFTFVRLDHAPKGSDNRNVFCTPKQKSLNFEDNFSAKMDASG